MIEEMVRHRPWVTEALCAGRADEWVFYSNPSGAERKRIAVAVETCHSCPVELDCLFDTLLAEKAMPGAVAGGCTPSQISKMRKAPEYIKARRFLHRPPCGTVNGYAVHREFGEDCLPCREARSRVSNPQNNPQGNRDGR